MAGYIRLQELVTLDNSSGPAVLDYVQALEQAIDVGDFNTLVVQVRKVDEWDDYCAIWLQHAPVLEEQAFEDLYPEFYFFRPGNETRVFKDTNRYIRYRAEVKLYTIARFLIDVVGRQ